MSIIVNSNIMSINSQRHLNSVGNQLKISMERLSSGRRLNSAKDDAAGMAISTRMSAQVSGMKVAQRNASDGVSLAQTAEGAMGEMLGMLTRMRDLALQSKNGVNSAQDRENLHQEFKELSAEITRTYTSVTFNDQKILGSDATSFVFQVGANNGDTVTVVLSDMGAMSGVSVLGTMTISTVSAAGSSIDVIDTALNAINASRAKLGAAQTRFDATISNLGITIENQSAALGRIVDADFASETATLSRIQVLQQAGVAMLAQANQAPQLALNLLR